jgi:hypothetical protein
MADDELDELYWAKPDDFTALRTSLADAAKGRGDTAAAKRIAAARKPTTAAWVVNRLVLGGDGIRQRLIDLGERLRAAHAAMEGVQIRELSREQRKLVDELARAALEAAELPNPSAALRDDVTDTLQAAIADPDVTARLGRLAKAERWSGFGEFGDAAQVFTPSRGKAKATAPVREKPAKQQRDDQKAKAAREEREKAAAALAQAERIRGEADDVLSERKSDLSTARLRLDDARNRLEEAERRLKAAQDAYDDAKQASRDAAELVKDAKARLK